jgi:group I intron endonuclease
MIKSGIYCISNLKGKKYIGSSNNIHKRIIAHFSLLSRNAHGNSHLQNAYNKHGENLFVTGIVEYCDKSILIEKEQYWIDFIGFDNLYNSRPLAESNIGIIQSEETKAKRREKSLSKEGNGISRETRIKMQESRLRNKIEFGASPRYREAALNRSDSVSLRHKGKKLSEETIEKMLKTKSERVYNKYNHTEEAKERIGNSSRGIPRTEEVKAKISATKRAKVFKESK